MPWRESDVHRHNKKLKTSKLRRLWVRIANQVLRKTGDDARAIREANAVAGRHHR